MVIISALVQTLWSKTSFCIMVASVTCSCMSNVQIAQDIFHLLKGPDPSYHLVLKFSNILPINNWYMAKKYDFAKVKVKVIGQTNGTIRFLDLKSIYVDAKIVILSALVRKLWSKTSFYTMVANVTRLSTSHLHMLKKFLIPWKALTQATVLQFDDNLPSRNQDMTQSVSLYSCDLERSKSSVRSIIFCTAISTLLMSIHVKFHWNLIASCSVSVA